MADIEFDCPKCNARQTATELGQGLSMKCSACGAMLHIPTRDAKGHERGKSECPANMNEPQTNAAPPRAKFKLHPTHFDGSQAAESVAAPYAVKAICSKCGKPQIQSATFCPQCGKDMRSVEKEPEPDAAPLCHALPINNGGAGRCLFCVLSLATLVLLFFLLPMIGLTLTLAVSIILVFLLHAARLVNIGMNPWLAFLAFVPLVNLVTLFWCCAYPGGYENTRRLDASGRITAALLLVLFTAGLAYGAFSAWQAGGIVPAADALIENNAAFSFLANIRAKTGVPVDDALRNIPKNLENWANVHIDDTNPADIELPSLKKTRLEVTRNGGNGTFVTVPWKFRGAWVYVIEHYRSTPLQGAAEFQVTKGGRVFVACHFGHQGTPDGEWDREAWSAADFKSNGWEAVGTSIVGYNDREHVIFTRLCESGESYRLRCNKYEPPYVIHF